jgi:pimeloyl-ACP methyl ester carboxylesterase
MIDVPPVSDKHQIDVIFVHGLGSDADGWVNSETKFDWPVELGKKDDRLRVFAVEYYAPMMGGARVPTSYQAIAPKLLEDLKINHVGARPIVFVAHSLGGIIVKQLLRHAEAFESPIFSKTRSVIFLSTPHAGATIATLGGHLDKVISAITTAATFIPVPHIGLFATAANKLLAWKLRISDLTSQLRGQEPALLELNLWYRTLKHISTSAYYETETFYQVLVVDPMSADPGVYGCVPTRAEAKDHITISKPKDAHDDLFKAVAFAVEDVRNREREGKGYPVLKNWIRESLQAKFPKYVDAGNFAEIPVEDRSVVEQRLRDQFRQRIKRGESFNTGAAAKSEFDIDTFALSLSLRERVRQQLELLVENLERAESAVRADSEPKTIIQLYRAARTLDQVLLEDFNYANLRKQLTFSRKMIQSKHDKNKAVDTSGATRQLLKRLEAYMSKFDEAKYELDKNPEFSRSTDPDSDI